MKSISRARLSWEDEDLYNFDTYTFGILMHFALSGLLDIWAASCTSLAAAICLGGWSGWSPLTDSDAAVKCMKLKRLCPSLFPCSLQHLWFIPIVQQQPSHSETTNEASHGPRVRVREGVGTCWNRKRLKNIEDLFELTGCFQESHTAHTFTLASFGDFHFLATLNCKMTSCESCASSCTKNKWQPWQSTLLLDFCWWTDRKDQRTKIGVSSIQSYPVESGWIWKPSLKAINKRLTCSQNKKAKVQSIPSC